MKPRIAKWDNLKLLLIFCVVSGHFLARVDDNRMAQSFFFFIYLFHMPAFMFISGLMSTRTIDQRRYAKMFDFLMAFLLTKVVLFAVKALFSHKYEFNLLEMNDISWYVFVLFVYYLITILVSRFPVVLTITVFVILACFTGYNRHIGSFLSLSRIICFYPFFLAGYHLDPDFVRYHTIGRPVKMLSFLYVAVTAAFSLFRIEHIWWYVKILRAKFPYVELAQYQSAGFLLRLIWYAGSALLIIAIITLTPDVTTPLTGLGARTLTVYMLHFVPLYLFYYAMRARKWLPKMPGCAFVAVLAALVTTLILCWKPFTDFVNIWITVPERFAERIKNQKD